MQYLMESSKVLLKPVSDNISRQLPQSALRKKKMTSSFHRGAKCEITQLKAGDYTKCVSVEKQQPKLSLKCLKMLTHSLKSTCVGFTLSKRDLVSFLRTPILKKICRRLLLTDITSLRNTFKRLSIKRETSDNE